jgi:hypothetical protein
VTLRDLESQASGPHFLLLTSQMVIHCIIFTLSIVLKLSWSITSITRHSYLKITLQLSIKYYLDVKFIQIDILYSVSQITDKDIIYQ